MNFYSLLNFTKISKLYGFYMKKDINSQFIIFQKKISSISIDWCKICPPCCDPTGGGPEDPNHPNPDDFFNLDRFASILNERVKNQEVVKSINYLNILESAKILKESGLDEHAEVVFNALPAIAKLKKDVSPMDISSSLIEYARMLDAKPERHKEASLLIDIALLNLHGRN